MARTLRRSAINIIDDLQKHGEDYDFYQAVRLLERAKQQKAAQQAIPATDGATQTKLPGRRRVRAQVAEQQQAAAQDRIRIRPELSLDYADSDIAGVQTLDDGSVELTTTFMGLYGISSPLPAYYTEELLDDEWDGNTAPRDFLDIIHQHLYPLLFKAWQKYRFGHQTVEQGESKYWDLLYSIIGLADPEFRGSSKYANRFLPYLGLLSQRQKSMLGLRTILRDALQIPNLDIEPCVTRDVSIPVEQHSLLSVGQVTLGVDATIGQLITDRMGKAIIRISGVSSEHFQTFINDQESLDFIRTLTKFYLVQPLDVEIVLRLDQGAIKTAEISGPCWSALGIDTWLQHETFGRDDAATPLTEVHLL